MSSQRGQASLEYVVVIGVVALAFVVGGAVVGADSVPRAVASQFERAFCLVAGGDCLDRAGPRPCVVRSREHTRERRLEIVVARFADGRAVLRELRSDGTVAVTLADSGEGALARGFNGAVGGSGQEVAAEGSVEAGGSLRAGRRWIVPDRAAADRLVERLSSERRLPLVAAVHEAGEFLLGRGDGGAAERFVAVGAHVKATGLLEAVGLSASAEALAGLTDSISIDQATGRRTVALRFAAGLSGELAAPVFGAAGGAVARATSVELTFERSGTPVALTLRARGDVRGSVQIGGEERQGGNRVLAEARLDLTAPGLRALASDFLGRAGRTDPAAIGLARDLGRRLADHARLDVRLYATKRSEETTEGLSFGSLGHEVLEVDETARLVHAAGREPGQSWSRRLDCVFAG